MLGPGALEIILAKRFEKDYHIKPLIEYESEGIGFSVDLDVPEGETKADVAIREWMSDAIKNDAFSLLGYQKDFNGRRKPSYDEFMNKAKPYTGDDGYQNAKDARDYDMKR